MESNSLKKKREQGKNKGKNKYGWFFVNGMKKKMQKEVSKNGLNFDANQ